MDALRRSVEAERAAGREAGTRAFGPGAQRKKEACEVERSA
jgi:hypothetical protein